MDTVERSQLSPAEFEVLKESDLSVLIAPYLIIGLVILAMLFVIRAVKMPKNGDKNHNIDFIPTLKRIFKIPHYREGVIAQFFYVGAQIMCWTFVIQYGTRLFMSQGMEEKAAEVLSQEYNIIAMIIFCISRFVCTFILLLPESGDASRDSCDCGWCFYVRCDFFARHMGIVLFSSCFGLYVTNVSHDLWHCSSWFG